ncbi:uncharacterized protein LOC122047504 isoform X1 [Zingiber officinale]|uniref:uncharacterized protein LOC122047504 isoform X1 n=1 Tax=Zingiber officinale TaxID=94328 RepID=UPI001C4BB548|nr:uncharacterized protein LOC122047504 isoform X1 [Zingiber officinale]
MDDPRAAAAGSSTAMAALEVFDVGPCDEPYQMGFLTGQNFSAMIKSRVAQDQILQHQLLPFALTPQAEPLLESICVANRQRYPRYWQELLGIAGGSGVPILHILLLNFRKELLPFVSKEEVAAEDDCSDVLVVNDSMAVAAHNEDANVALVGHTFMVRARLPDGLSFVAYSYAGELPSCAFGFNSNGIAFTLNSVPPKSEEMTRGGGIGRNFISRDLLEASNLEDALNRVCSTNIATGHSYNLVDLGTRRILNVETASRNRHSVHEVKKTPFFHANMYLHLEVKQVEDENSISRQRRAAQLSKETKAEILSILGDSEDAKYPIYMTGPRLYTLCTVLVDADERTISIFQCNPKEGNASLVLPMD